MRESIQDIITRLLRYQRVPSKMTKDFMRWTHNRDILPRLQQKLEMILGAYGKFHPIVYDTQGIHDDGSDLILRHREDSTGNGDYELISFQVKSYDDLNKKTYMQELKAQHDDTFRKVIGLQHYFIILCTCTDEDVHKNKIRNIAAEFRSAYRTEIIEPEFSYTFLHHPQYRVDAIVKRTLEADDIVFKKAIEIIEFTSPSARALATFIAVQFAAEGKHSFDQSILMTDQALRSVYGQLRERQEKLLENFYATHPKKRLRRTYRASMTNESHEEDEEPIQIANFEEQVAEDLAILEDDLIDLDMTSDTVVVRGDSIMPLAALIMDALVRYNYTAETVLPYMFGLVGVLD
jgi:hypothetical protein